MYSRERIGLLLGHVRLERFESFLKTLQGRQTALYLRTRCARHGGRLVAIRSISRVNPSTVPRRL